jgi:ABC-2 type transport system permease protein
MYTLIAIPGVILSLVLGAAYYHFGLHISLLVIPAMLLIVLGGIFLGYALAHCIKKAQIT